ncbi:hypothetical protein BC940DRAFT_336001 [Gongronella butleri]|nr:hypothetical protein BC940DRAFT_336001 [Gongronella butleri]
MIISQVEKTVIQQVLQIALEIAVGPVAIIFAACIGEYAMRVASSEGILMTARAATDIHPVIKFKASARTCLFIVLLYAGYTRFNLFIMNTAWPVSNILTKDVPTEVPYQGNFSVSKTIFNGVSTTDDLCGNIVGCGIGIGKANVTLAAVRPIPSLSYTPTADGHFYDNREFVLAPFSYWVHANPSPPMAGGSCMWTNTTVGNVITFLTMNQTGSCNPTSDSNVMLAQMDLDMTENGYLLPAVNDMAIVIPGIWFHYGTQTLYRKTLARMTTPNADFLIESTGAVAMIWKPAPCLNPGADMISMGFKTSLPNIDFCGGISAVQTVTVTDNGYIVEYASISPGYQGADVYQMFYRREYNITTLSTANRGNQIFLDTGVQYELYNDVGTPWQFAFARYKFWDQHDAVLAQVLETGATVRDTLWSSFYNSYNMYGYPSNVVLAFQINVPWLCYCAVLFVASLIVTLLRLTVPKFQVFNRELSEVVIRTATPQSSKGIVRYEKDVLFIDNKPITCEIPEKSALIP